jgi:CIC family chloride channel protein
MAALLSASSRAPLAAIAITAEITDNHELLLAMIVCCLSAVMTAERCGGKPIYSVLLQRMRQRSA